MKRLHYAIILWFIVASACAQNLVIKGFEYKQSDLSARTSMRSDLNGNKCALVKVRLVVSGAKFSGLIVGDVEERTSEYWVYMPDKAKKLTVTAPGFLPIEIVFADYGVTSLSSLNTYMLTLELPKIHSTSSQMQKVKFKVIPKDAKLMVDNLDFELVDGQTEIPLGMGTHTYQVSSPYHKTEIKTLSIDGSTEYKLIEISLKQAYSYLSVSTNPEGADVFLRGKKIGTTPLVRYPIMSGVHQLEIVRSGYQSETISIEAKDSEEKKIEKDLSSLIDVNLTSTPSLATIQIDGKQIGMTPKHISLTAGEYDLFMQAHGYIDYKKKIQINGEREIHIKMKRRYFNKYGGYLEAGFRGGSLFSFGADFGLYIYNVNAEFSVHKGFGNSGNIYWQTIVDKPQVFTYSPTLFAYKLGYGFNIGNRVKVTPQIGLYQIRLRETSVDSNLSQIANGANVLSGALSVKCLYAINKFFGVSVTAEYLLPFKKSSGFEAMSEISSKIDSWSKGFYIHADAVVYF